jgi:adenylate cyclase
MSKRPTAPSGAAAPSDPPGDDPAVPVESIRAELRSILGSSAFDASARNRSFLEYVVEETLAGRAERIKAYTIATSVFGRDANFDPQLDSIVRIEAGRLRRSLERHYLTEGRSSRVRIEIPRGGYVPVFRDARPAAQPAPPSGTPRVLVTGFEQEGDPAVFPSFARGFTRSLIIALTRFTGLSVFCAESALRRGGEAAPEARWRDLDADYVVTGQTSLQPDSFEVDVLLLEAASGRAVWAETFRRDLRPAEIIALRNDVANRVARSLAQPYGAIQTDLARDADGAAPEALGNYAAVLQFYAYWRSFDGAMVETVRAGLERAVADEPDYAEAHACLSLVFTNMARFGQGGAGLEADARARALALARRAVALAPASSWARHALGLALWFSGDAAGGLRALEAGHRLNPNDTTILADLGQRYAMLGRWDEAAAMLEESYASNPSQPGSYRIGLFLCHYAKGRHAEALEQARLVDAPQVVYGHVAVAAAAAELGLAAEAAQAVAAIRAIDPDYGAHVARDLESRHLAPDMIRRLLASLAKAGLPAVAPPQVRTAS